MNEWWCLRLIWIWIRRNRTFYRPIYDIYIYTNSILYARSFIRVLRECRIACDWTVIWRIAVQKRRVLFHPSPTKKHAHEGLMDRCILLIHYLLAIRFEKLLITFGDKSCHVWLVFVFMYSDTFSLVGKYALGSRLAVSWHMLEHLICSYDD